MNQADLIVARIERARQDRGISVAELARRIDVDRKRLWYVLNGQRSMHVDEEHPAPRPGERDSQAQRRGGLGRPSLLVGDGYRPACHLASSHLRRCRVSGGQEVSESQSGAGPCRSAAFGRPSARSRISFGNGRPHMKYAVGKRGNWTGISSVSPVSQTHPTEGA